MSVMPIIENKPISIAGKMADRWFINGFPDNYWKERGLAVKWYMQALKPVRTNKSIT